METIQLFAPNGLEIVGVLAADGSVRRFDYSYNRTTKVSVYRLEGGHPQSEGPATLVDSQGNTWNSADVEWHTLFERRQP